MRWVWCFCLMFSYSSWGQGAFSLKIKSISADPFIAGLNYKQSFSNTADRNKEIQRILFSLYDQAYLAASVDSTQPISSSATSDSLIVYLNKGSLYKWATLGKGNIDRLTLEESGFRERNYFNKPFYYKEVANIQEKILRYCENNGYPFASIRLDSIKIEGEKIAAQMNLEKNNFVKIDSVINRGGGKIAPVYLQNYLGIKKNSLYNESTIKSIASKLKQIPFLSERIPYRVLFSGDKAKVELFLEKKKASRFDGIIGLLPNNKTGKLLLTGEVLLKLQNAVGRGELLELNWRRLQVGTQDLRTQAVLPFLLKSPFGMDASFKLYKKDSTYLEINPNIGIQYLISGGNYFKVFMNRRNMTLIATDNLKFLTTLPPYADVSSTLYGIGIKSEKLDYRFNPRQGYFFTGSASIGNRTIKKNDKLNEIIYKDLKLRSAQYSGEIEAMLFIPLKNRSTIKLGNQSARMENTTLFLNDLYRIGGLKTLRGFDEESVFASFYSIFTLEYRFIFEENSYLCFFSDAAYLENKSISFTGDRYDAPYSVGAGISFQTKAGIFSLNYALGSQYGNALDLRRGKVHFGIVSHF